MRTLAELERTVLYIRVYRVYIIAEDMAVARESANERRADEEEHENEKENENQ